MFIKPFLMIGFVALTTTHAGAESARYVTDAFGILPETVLQDTPRARWAGLKTIVALDGTAPRPLSVPAGQTDEMLLFVGPKSAVAGKDKVHAVTVVLDAAGNMIADGNAAGFILGKEPRQTAETRNGLADILFLPTPNAGLFHAGASTGNRQTARGEYRVVPDLASVIPTLNQQDVPSLRDTFAALETGPLADQFGNDIGDGVGIQVLGKSQGGDHSLATGVTVENTAWVQLLTREMGTTGQFRAQLGSHVSAPVGFFIETLTAPEPPQIKAWSLPAIAAIEISVGPFLSSAGHMLNDGTPVTLSVHLNDGQTTQINGWLKDGYVDVLVLGSAGSLPADVLIGSETGEFNLRLERLQNMPRPAGRRME